jgi:SulP family sulfate permease
MLVLTVLFGTALLSYLPRLMLGALLIYIGVDLLYEWVVAVWAKFPKVDALIVMTILVTIGLTNFLWGILIGTFLTILLFVVNYSRVNVVRYTLTGTTYHSRFFRQLEHTRLLERHGDQIFIFKLEGFIFFGTANYLYEQVHQRIRNPGSMPVRYMILDFEMVSGLDSTGLLSFEKMLQYTQDRQVNLVFSGLKDRALRQFENGGFGGLIEGLYLFPQLDRAVEWCETSIIQDFSFESEQEKSLTKKLQPIIPDEKALTRLLSLMSRRHYAPGEYLMRAGDPPDEIMLIEDGQVTVQLEPPEGEPIRLETTAGGRVIGELGFYLDQPRTAHVRADTDTDVYVLTRQDLDRLQAESPDVLLTLSRIVVHQTSQRVVNMTQFHDAVQQ